MVKTWKMEHDNDAHGNEWWNINADDRSVANVYKEEDAKLIALVPKMVEACVTTFSAHVEPRVDWRALKHEIAMEKIIAVIKELEKE